MSRIARLLAAGFLAAGLAAGLAACGSANAGGPPASIDPGALHVTARGIAFEQRNVVAPANRPFQIAFDNEDSAPHNITVVAPNGSVAFSGAIFGGVSTQVYSVPALKPGSYSFHCDVHPDMTGTMTVR